jgi:hypothetical protein
VAKVLGKALLWLIVSPSSDCLPQALRDRVRTACNNVAQLPVLVKTLQRKSLLSSHTVQTFGRAALWHCSGVQVATTHGVKQATGDER